MSSCFNIYLIILKVATKITSCSSTIVDLILASCPERAGSKAVMFGINEFSRM